MPIKRNLFISSIALLRLASNFLPDPQTSRVFARPLHITPNPRVPIPLRNLFFPSAKLSRFVAFSSESTAVGGGETATAKCWNCGAAAAFLVCGSCRSVQLVDHSVDYFKIFGLCNWRVYILMKNKHSQIQNCLLR